MRSVNRNFESAIVLAGKKGASMAFKSAEKNRKSFKLRCAGYFIINKFRKKKYTQQM